MLELDPDGCISLLVAIARRWIEDAQGNPAELAAVADWLEVSAAELRAYPVKRSIAAPAAPKPAKVCGVCGAAIQFTSDSPAAHKRRFCSNPCLRKATNARRRKDRS